MQRVISRGLQQDESTISNEQFEIVVADLGNFRIQVLSENGEFLRHLSLLGSNQQISFQRDQLNGLRTTRLREYAALNNYPLPNLSGSRMTQLYTLATQLHPSCPAFARIAAAQSQWREIRSHFHHPLAITYAPAERELVFVDHDNAKVFIYNADGSRSKWLGLSREHTSGVSSVHSVMQLSVSSGASSSSTTNHFQDRLYVSDPQSHRIAVFDAKSLQLLFFIGATTYGDQTLCSPGFLPGELHHPSFLTYFTRRTTDSSSPTATILVVSDSGNHSISLFDAWSGRFYGQIGRGFGHLDGFLNSPEGVAVSKDRWLYVCDQRNHRIQVFDLLEILDGDGADSSFVRAFGRLGHAPGELSFPSAVAICPVLPQVDPKCNLGAHREAKVVVGDTGNHRVQVFSADAACQLLLLLDVHLTPFDQPLVPMGVYVDARCGSILAADAASQCVLVFRRNGAFLASFGSTVEPENRFDRPISIAFFSNKTRTDDHEALNGQLLIADGGRSDVCVFELRQGL